MLDEGLNNELTFKVKNEIEYVVLSNFLEYASPVADHIKYISGDKDVITVTMKINKDFKVDDTKQLLFNYKKVDYTTELTNTGTILEFTADVVATQRYNVEFGEGLIVGANGETNEPKESYDFSVVDINTIDLPEKVIFTDLPANHWAFDYITQLAMPDTDSEIMKMLNEIDAKNSEMLEIIRQGAEDRDDRNMVHERCRQKHDEIAEIQKKLEAARSIKQTENTNKSRLCEIYDMVSQMSGKFEEYDDNFTRTAVTNVKILSETKVQVTLFGSITKEIDISECQI